MDKDIVLEVKEVTKEKELVPTYGILVINHAYNEGKLTFKEWMELSREWALKMKEQYGSKQQRERSA